MITHYTKQNRIQKELVRLGNIFTTNWNQVHRAGDCGYEAYNFGATKKEKTAVGLIIFSAIVPFTMAGVTIPLIYKTMLGGRK